MATAQFPVSYLHQALIEHAAESPALKRVIESDSVAPLLTSYDEANARAVWHRRNYTWTARVALYAATIGTLLGAMFLLPIAALSAPSMRISVGLLQSSALIVSFLAVQWLLWWRLLACWMDSREEAEGRRSEIFTTIVRADIPGDADQNASLPERLGCFVKCYVEDQLAYFRKRGREHARAHRNLTPLKIAAYGFGAFSIVIGAGSILGLLSSWGMPLPSPVERLAQWIAFSEPHRLQLGFGVFASSLLSFVGTSSLINQHERNAWQYAVIARSLEHILQTDLAGATDSAMRGDRDRVLAFCDKIQDVLSVENRTWKLSRLAGGATPAINVQMGHLVRRKNA